MRYFDFQFQEGNQFKSQDIHMQRNVCSTSIKFRRTYNKYTYATRSFLDRQSGMCTCVLCTIPQNHSRYLGSFSHSSSVFDLVYYKTMLRKCSVQSRSIPDAS